LAKKKKSTPKPPAPSKLGFDPERNRWFTPAAFGVVFVALLILFADFIFSGKMLYGSDTIQAGIFFRSMLVDYVHEFGTVPQWNPYIFCGMPYVEAFHGDIFYPLSVLKFFGSIFKMLGLNLVLHFFLAGLFMYFAGRQFGLGKVASLLSGVCYMFAGYLMSFVAPGHDGKIFVTALFPLVMLFLERGFERRSFVSFSLLGLVLGVIILSPHPQMSYFTLWAVSFYALYKLIIMFRAEKSIRPLLFPAGGVAYAVVIGLLLSAIQFYPGYIYTSEYSPRADSKSGWDWSTSWSMHEEGVVSQVIPEFVGTSSGETKTFYWGKNSFKDNSESVGVVTMFLALIGLFFSKRRGAWFFGGLALFALIYALGANTPVYKLFFYLIPKVKALRAPSMIMFLFLFSASLLAGMGLQRIIEAKRAIPGELGKRFNYLLYGAPGFLLLLALLFSANGQGMLRAWCALFYSEAPQTMVQQGVSKLDVAFMNLPAIQSGAWFAFLSVAIVALLVWLYRSGKAGLTVLVLVAAVPLLDGCRFNSRFISTLNPDQFWGANPVVTFLQSKQGGEPFRVMNLGSLRNDQLAYHKIEMVTGYHGNQLRWYDDLLGGPGAQNQTNPHLLNLVGAKYLLMPGRQPIPPGFFGPRPVKDFAISGRRIVENQNAFPRVYLVDEYQVHPNRADIYPLVLGGVDDLRQTVYLEQEPPIQITAATDTASADSAWVVYHGIDSVAVGVRCESNRLLVMTDNYYDAWQVTIDGEAAELLRAYGTFRAVAVPGGASQVVFEFESARYQTGRLVTWLTALFLGVILVGSYFVRRRESSPTGETE
jgi:hypothetical protein